MERARKDVCNLDKMELILGMLWLTAYNPEIDWEKGEVKMTRCPPIYGRRKQKVKEKKVRKIEKNEDEEVLKKLVPRRFWKWKKVFGKDASTKDLVPCHRIKGGIYTKKGESILTIKRGKRGSTDILSQMTTY